MYIWSVYKLAGEFQKGTVTERQQLYYLLVFIVISYVVSDPYLNSLMAYETQNGLDILMLPLGLVIGMAGTIYCYNIAQKYEANTGFLPRYICLGLPVLVQLTVAVFALMLSLFVINDFVISIPGINYLLGSNETTIIDIIGYSVIEIYYFVYLGMALKVSYA